MTLCKFRPEFLWGKKLPLLRIWSVSTNNGPLKQFLKKNQSYCSDHAHTVGCHIKEFSLSESVSCWTLWKAQIKRRLHGPIKDTCSILHRIYTANLLFTVLYCNVLLMSSKRDGSLQKQLSILFNLASLQSLQWASIWSQSQTKRSPIHVAAPENRFADQTVSSVRCAYAIIDQLMPYNVLPSVINGIHKHYCWNYSTILLMLNSLQNTDHFPNIIMPMITML